MFFWILNTKKIRRLVKSVLRWGFHGKKQIEIMFFSFFLVFEVNQKYLLLYVFCKLIFRAPKSMLLHISPVHVVLVSLLVDQLSSLFLHFFGRPKKYLFSPREFLVNLWFFWSTKFLFGVPKFLFSIPKNQEPDQKKFRDWPNIHYLRLNNFFWSTKKSEK